MALITNPKYNPAVAGSQQYVFDAPTSINSNTGQLSNTVKPVINAVDLGASTFKPTAFTATPTPSITNINSDMVTPQPALDSGIKAATTTGISPEASAASSIANRLSAAYEKLTGKAGFQAQQEQALGVTEATKGLNEVNAQITALKNDSAAQTLALGGQGRGITQDLLSRQGAEIERNRAIKALSLSSIAEAYKGNLATATDAVTRAVNAQYQPAQDEIDYLTKQYAIMSQEATGAEKRRIEQAQAVNDAKKLELETQKDNKTAIMNLAVEAAKNQAPALLIQQAQNAKTPQEALTILSKYMTNPNKAAQDVADLAYKNAQTSNIKATTAKLQAETNKTNQEAANLAKTTGGNAGDLLAYAQDMVSTGKVPSVQELKNSNLTVGQVSQIAKELPKAPGEIVDINTGIKSGKLSSAQVEGFAALKDLVNKLDEAKAKFSNLTTGIAGGIFGNIAPSTERQQYNIMKSEIVDLLSRARSGAALTESEIKTYSDKLPGTFNKAVWLGNEGSTMLEGLKNSIANKLKTSLAAQGASMYGFSTVKLGGDEYSVGQEIEVNGMRGRVNPDGSITKL